MCNVTRDAGCSECVRGRLPAGDTTCPNGCKPSGGNRFPGFERKLCANCRRNSDQGDYTCPDSCMKSRGRPDWQSLAVVERSCYTCDFGKRPAFECNQERHCSCFDTKPYTAWTPGVVRRCTTCAFGGATGDDCQRLRNCTHITGDDRRYAAWAPPNVVQPINMEGLLLL